MHTLITDLCLLLLNLKIPITRGNWGFIWKYQKYARKSQNDATIKQIILKTLTRGEWPSGLRCCRLIRRFLAQILLGAWPGLPPYEAPDDLLVKTGINAVINIESMTFSPQ